jgi:type IV pilus assembly protein PilQ
MKRLGKLRQLRMMPILMLFLWASGVALAQEAMENEKTGEVLTPLEQRMQKRITVDFSDTPIDEVLRSLAAQAETNIVKSPKVTGTVTATLKDVPLEEALNHILASQGYTYVTSENMMRVVPIGEVTETTEPVVNRVYLITYADVKQVETAVGKFISKRGTISSSPGTSNIIVSDIESKIKAIDTFIEEIDRITPQILVEARIYDVVSTDNLDFGFEWFLGRNTTYGGTGVADVGVNPTGGRRDPFGTGGFNSGISQTSKTDGLIRFGILNDALDLDVLFSASHEKICAKLLASPRVLVLDNEMATFKIVQEVPFQELTQTAGGGNIGTTNFKEVGVELNVTPHVARDSMIRLHLKPKFSTQTDTVSIIIPVPGSTPITSPQPVIANREADTKILIRDGQTVVLGGLRRQTVAQEISKIPLLGDIPLLGNFFKFEGDEVANSELLVFVTPRIVEEAAMSDTEAEQYDATETGPAICPPPRVEGLAKCSE